MTSAQRQPCGLLALVVATAAMLGYGAATAEASDRESGLWSYLSAQSDDADGGDEAEQGAIAAPPAAARQDPFAADAQHGIPLWLDVHSGVLIDLFENPPGVDLNSPLGVSLEVGGTLGWRLLPRDFTTPFVALSVSLMFTTVFYDDPSTGTTKQDSTLGSKVDILIGVEFLGFNAFVDVGFRSHWSGLRTDGGIDILQGDQAHDYLGIGFGYGDSGSDLRFVLGFPYNHGATNVTFHFELHYSF